MSAAATAAGYLYASGRLRNRRGEEGSPREDEPPQHSEPPRHSEPVRRNESPRRSEPPRRSDPSPRRGQAARRRDPLVGRLPQERAPEAPAQQPEKARPAPRIEYRTRRWRREY
jgi:hypothetical protein